MYSTRKCLKEGQPTLPEAAPREGDVPGLLDFLSFVM